MQVFLDGKAERFESQLPQVAAAQATAR